MHFFRFLVVKIFNSFMPTNHDKNTEVILIINFLKERNIRYNCHICSKSFKRNWNLKEHQKIHQRRKKTFCPKCPNKSFFAKKNLIKHLKDYHNETLTPLHKLEWKDLHSDKNYTCDYCGKSHPRKHNLRLHMNAYHMPKPTAAPVRVEPITSKSAAKKPTVKQARRHRDEKPSFEDKIDELYINSGRENSRENSQTSNSMCVEVQSQQLNAFDPKPSAIDCINPSSVNRLLKQPPVPSSTSAQLNEIIPIKSDLLVLSKNEEFGVHIVAKQDIEIGKQLLDSSAYAKIMYVSCSGSCCFSCGEINDFKKIECKHCINVWFCSRKCSQNREHKVRCYPMFEKNDCKIIRLVAEIMKVGSNEFISTEMYLKFCHESLSNNSNENIGLSSYSEYGEILTLKSHPEERHPFIARRVADLIGLVPQFSSVARESRRLLIRIAYRHSICVAFNAFSIEKNIAKGGTLHKFELHNIMSRFNHACQPNVEHFILEEDGDDYTTYCIAKKQIKKGEQCFINYFGGHEIKNTEERQRIFNETWHFTCTCIECEL